MDIPLFSGSLLQNQCQGKWRLNLEKASKSLTVIVVNSSPVPGSFIYCKSLHLPELLTSKGFYWSPLGASLMCATIYFNINILHMYRNIYSKWWETDCSGCLGGIFQMGDWSSQSEQQRDIGCINSDVGRGELMCWDRINRSLKVILTFHISHLSLNLYKSLHNISRITKERVNQARMICRWRIKRGLRFFQTPSACLSECLLKCPLKRWFVCWCAAVWPCQRVSGSSAGPCHMWNGPVKRVLRTPVRPQSPLPKQIKKHM